MKALKLTNWEETPLNIDAVNVNESLVKDVFCEAWDKGQPVLEYAVLAVKKPLAKLILQVAIRICNGIAKRHCGA